MFKKSQTGPRRWRLYRVVVRQGGLCVEHFGCYGSAFDAALQAMELFAREGASLAIHVRPV